jgi:predicted transcriptional regulator
VKKILLLQSLRNARSHALRNQFVAARNTGKVTLLLLTDDRGLEHARRGCYVEKEMSTLQEIKSAIANLSPHDKALLTAELFALKAEPDGAALDAALERGLKDVEAGRVRPIDEVKAMIPGWTSKS